MYRSDITSIQRPTEPFDETALVPAPRVDDDYTRIATADDLETRVITRMPADQRHAAPAQTQQHTTASFATLAPIQADPGTLPGNTQQAGDVVAKQVGRYLVLEKLGRGGMASVFRAHDPSIGRDVAIKFLHSALCEDEEYRGRFLREARAAGGLSHANIVTVHDVGEIEGRPYMAMELLEGQPLAEVMDKGHTFAVRDVVVVGIQLARALDYAHSRGIVHRDIKPGNIALLSGSNTIKVMDFGIAHMDAGGGADHTRVGDVLGTPQYMSPEQTRGEKLDGRSDLFSVGIVMYQMLSGQRPFQGGSMVAIAMKIAQEQAPPLDKLRPDIPSALRRIVERCLAKSPDQRFQNGRELSEALTRLLAQIDEADRIRERPRIIPLRVKWAATMALIVAVVMGLVATVVTRQQYAAMMDQVSENGAGLARFIAAQNAEAALRGDQWQNVGFSVQRMMETGDFQSITIADKQGIVRVASDPALLERPFAPPPQANVIAGQADGIKETRFQVNGESILGFEAPITYAGSNQGKVLLGLKESPLTRVAHLSMSLMGILVVVTVLAVAIAMYFVANWFARPIKVVTDAMDEIARGHVEHRIAETRKDEFGLLYAAFDRMAQAIQDARSGISVAVGPPSEQTTDLRAGRPAAAPADAKPSSDAS